MSEPFFILGSPRSGTTLLRNLLRRHPRLECPEETFFYRWSCPCRTEAYERVYRNNRHLLQHREMDGISDDEFWEVYQSSRSRKDLQVNYMRKYLENLGKPDSVWFDKTPQNSNGLLSIHRDFPKSKIVHVVRHPLNVVTSIMQGRSVGPEKLWGAVNVWMEAVTAVEAARPLLGDRIVDVRYEDLVGSPGKTLGILVESLGFEPIGPIRDVVIGRHNKRFLEYLTEKQIEKILNTCGKMLERHNYPTKVESYLEGVGASPVD